MNNYLVGYKVEGILNSHIDDVVFKVGTSEVKICFNDPNKHKGIIKAFVTVNANNHKEAFKEGFFALEETINYLSFIMKSSLYASNVFVILKDETGASQRMCYRQIVEERFRGLFLKEDSKNEAQRLIDRFQKNSKYSLILRWLRYGYRARTLIERFHYYWLALERIVGESNIESRCPQCGCIRTYRNVKKGDIKKRLLKYYQSLSNEEFKLIWKHRQYLFHGGKKPDTEMINNLNNIIPKILETIEGELENGLEPNCRIAVTNPIGDRERYLRQAYFKFNTKNIGLPFAMDFPTDDQLIGYFKNSEIESKFGFELMDAERFRRW